MCHDGQCMGLQLFPKYPNRYSIRLWCSTWTKKLNFLNNNIAPYTPLTLLFIQNGLHKPQFYELLTVIAIMKRKPTSAPTSTIFQSMNLGWFKAPTASVIKPPGYNDRKELSTCQIIENQSTVKRSILYSLTTHHPIYTFEEEEEEKKRAIDIKQIQNS